MPLSFNKDPFNPHDVFKPSLFWESVPQAPTPTPAPPRKRGSLIDVVTLTEFPFYYEPRVRNKEKTGYASRPIIGNRLPDKQWIGEGEDALDLEVFLLDQETMLTQLNNFRSLLLPQDDIGAPHPVYVIVGGMYAGRWFVLEEIDNHVEGFQYNDMMTPYEALLRLRLCEVPVTETYTGE